MKSQRPDFIQEDIDALEAARKDANCYHVDCLLNELQGTINSAAADGIITEEFADYLWGVYITGNIKNEKAN